MQRARRFLRPLKLSVEGSALDVFFFSPKKYRPPRPMGVKGGCSPQNNLPKSAQLLAELKGCRNKNLYKRYSHFSGPMASQSLPTRMSIWKGRSSADYCPTNRRTLAEPCEARFTFICGTCDRKNRAASPDRFWSRIRTCSIQTFGGRCSLFRRTIRMTVRLE